MYKVDFTDLVGGSLLTLVGAAVAIVSVTYYPMGTLQRMGPGMFPAGLGVILSVFGIILALQSLRRPGERPDLRVRSPLLVLGGIAAFALLVSPFGMIPSIVAITVVASLADLRVRPLSLALLCLGLCLLAPFVFRVCLGLQIPMVRWPF